MKFDGFDWDWGNRFKNEKKHGLDRTAIESFFEQSILFAPDLKHSEDEDRFLAIGRMPDGREMIVIFALREKRGKRLVRPISARRMNKRETKKYEEKTTQTQK